LVPPQQGLVAMLLAVLLVRWVQDAVRTLQQQQQ
jgi:hypothetical protein